MGKEQAVFINALSEAERDRNNMWLSLGGKIEVSFFAEVGPECTTRV